MEMPQCKLTQINTVATEGDSLALLFIVGFMFDDNKMFQV